MTNEKTLPNNIQLNILIPIVFNYNFISLSRIVKIEQREFKFYAKIVGSPFIKVAPSEVSVPQIFFSYYQLGTEITKAVDTYLLNSGE